MGLFQEQCQKHCLFLKETYDTLGRDVSFVFDIGPQHGLVPGQPIRGISEAVSRMFGAP